MKKFSLLLLASFILTHSYAQNMACDCKKELIFLDSKIKKTPSYKINIKAYDQAYPKILKQADSAHSLYECFLLLNTLLLSIDDNHSRVFGTEKGVIDEIKNDTKKFSAYKQSELYNAYPKPNIDLDSLQQILTTKEIDEKEGIYSAENNFKIGVFKNPNEDNYIAIILESDLDVWRPGEVMYTFIPYGKDYFLGVGGSIFTKQLIAYTERIDNGLFHLMGLKKEGLPTNYSSKFTSDEIYYREELSDDITYLRIGDFNSWYPVLGQAEKFYKSLEGTLNKNNLIIDLRNNGGGGQRNSDILYKILKPYAKEHNLYVLINHRTASNAEQFAVKLSNLKNTTLFGQRTNGTLAYELVGATYTLPCGSYIAQLTSKKHAKYITMESNGIEPDVTFDLWKDWIEQLRPYIEENN